MRKRRWLMLIPLWLLGMWLLSCGFTALAMVYLRQAILPRKPGATEEIRQQADRKGDTARRLSTVAIWLNPFNAHAYRNRGIARLYDDMHGDLPEILSDLTISIKLNRRDAVTYLYHAMVYPECHPYQEIGAVEITDYTAVLALNPQDTWMSYGIFIDEHPYAHMNRGLCYAGLGQNDKAIADFTAAITQDPGYWWTYDKRVKSYDRLGQYDLAAADYTGIISLLGSELTEGFSYCYENRGDDYMKLGRYDQAAADYTSTISYWPNNGQLYFKRGMAYQQWGQSAQASADFARAYELGYRPR